MSRFDPPTKSYRVSNGWLEAHSAQPHAHCDLVEIVANKSPYLNWIVANEGADRAREQALANLDPSWITVWDDSHGDDVKCELWDDTHPHVRSLDWSYMSVRRVYAHNTTGRNIEFLGNGNRPESL